MRGVALFCLLVALSMLVYDIHYVVLYAKGIPVPSHIPFFIPVVMGVFCGICYWAENLPSATMDAVHEAAHAQSAAAHARQQYKESDDVPDIG